MAFELKKGNAFQLQKTLSNIIVGCGWDVSARVGTQYDLDVHAFGLNQGKLYRENGDFPLALTFANTNLPKAPELGDNVFRTRDFEMIHFGDNRTGVGDGDDETIELTLNKIPEKVNEIALWVTIYEGAERKQTFDAVSNAYVRILDKNRNAELCRYAMNEKFVGAFAVQVGSLMRQANQVWQFVAIGNGAQADLGDILAHYGA